MSNFEKSKSGIFSVLTWITPDEWAHVALKDLGALMTDHAWCERKASGTCMSILGAHIEYPQVAEPMIRLAREELEHFHMVFNFMNERGLVLGQDHPCGYVRQLRVHCRPGHVQLQDRLLISSLIEARSCERLGLIGKYIQDPQLKDFYQRLEKAEARHFEEFIALSEDIFGVESTQLRLKEMADIEASIISNLPFGSRVH